MQTISRLALLHVATSLFLFGCSKEAVGDVNLRAHELSLAVDDHRAFAAWHGGYAAKDSAIYIQPLNTVGQPEGAPIRATDGTALAYEPDLILAGGQPVVAWYQKDPASGRLTAWLAGLTRDGKNRWRLPLRGTGGDGRNPVVRAIGDRLQVAWLAESAEPGGKDQPVWYQTISLDGQPIGVPQQIGRASSTTWNLNAAVSGNTFLVTYDAAIGSKANELQLIAVTDRQARQVSLSKNDGFASLYPDLQLSAAGQAALTWFDEKDGNQEVYLSAGPIAAFLNGDTPAPRRVTHSQGDSIGAYLAWSGEIIGLAWSDQVDSRRALMAQLFDAGGNPIADAVTFDVGDGQASVPAIRAQGGDFLIAWNSYVLQGSGAHMSVTRSDAHFARLRTGDQAGAPLASR